MTYFDRARPGQCFNATTSAVQSVRFPRPLARADASSGAPFRLRVVDRVGLQARDGAGADDRPCAHVALPVHAADHAALTERQAAFEQLVGAFGRHLGSGISAPSPTERRMAGRIKPSRLSMKPSFRVQVRF